MAAGNPKHTGCTIAVVLVVLLASPIIIIFTAIVYSNIVNAVQRPSRVDVSPIAKLNEEQVSQAEEAIMQLGELGLISEPRIEDFDESHTTLTRVFETGWTDNEVPGRQASIMIFVSIDRQEETAISTIQSMRVGRTFGPRVDVVNDNNTEALLRYPSMPVSASGWFMPTSERIVRSQIRIGNVRITLWESRHRSDGRELLTNQFIEMLVEQLQEG